LPLPLTGLARKALPRSARRARTAAEHSVETVEQSTTMPGVRAGSASRRSMTWSRSREVETMVKTTSRSATSTGSSTTFAPDSVSASALLRVRFHTLTSSPAASNRRAIAAPMCPAPSQPTLSFVPVVICAALFPWR
jgi:hypothetical protein